MSDQPNTEVPSQDSSATQGAPPVQLPTSEPPAIPDWAQQLISQNQALQSQIQQVSQNNSFLAQQLNQFAQRPEPVQQIDPNDFHSNPVDTISRIVAQQIQPLQQFTAQTMKRQQIQEAIDYFNSIDSEFKNFQQNFASLLQQAEVNPQTVQAAYYTAKGYYASQPKNTNGAPVVTRQPDTTGTPAHLRPSGPSGNAGTPTLKLRPLSEQEEMVRKTSKMSHAEYLYHRGEITKEQFQSTRGAK
jgi:hypothetical protein